MKQAQDFWQRSMDDPEGFWREQAALIDWETPFEQVFDGSNAPFSRYYVGGTTNLCYNAVDRHAQATPDARALIYVSNETGTERIYSFAELQEEVERCAALLLSLGVKKGERVLIYMPMIAEAIFTMLACVRIGAVHSVVFGGFASQALADRIEDLQPTVIATADAGLRGGKVIEYKGLLEGALKASAHQPDNIIFVDRGLVPDADWSNLNALSYYDAIGALDSTEAPIAWLESSEPSYVLYTSGTTGKPKGVQRDTGGHAVAMIASMRHIYDGKPGEAMFATSDIGWVVGHSYIVYGPLLNGMATIVYEGTPIHPDPGAWWKVVETHKPSVLFSSPTAIRLLKKYDIDYITKHNISSVRRIFLAGEPLDETTARWASDTLGQKVYDHFWQTETGWPIIGPLPGVEDHDLKWGSPSFPIYGYDVQIIDDETGEVQAPGGKGMLAIKWPLPPGAMSTVWQDDARFKDTYFKTFGDTQYYLTFDFALRDEDGYIFLLGRTDDVINVAGHRLGTKEIEGAICTHSGVAEAAVVGVADSVKGQVPVAFAVLKSDTETITAKDLTQIVDSQLGAIARPARLVFVPGLPKTRSGKILRRALQALAEGKDPGDLPTLEDANVLEQVKVALS